MERVKGIIPARAGFTYLHATQEIECWDHPRSRGVYEMTGKYTSRLDGSSPLARGLPAREDADRPGCGIIPARAEFTAGSPPGQGACPDHPRSRGVYPAASTMASLVGGSSPLARGLHPHLRGNQTGLRIIPARAGFTGADLLKLDVDTGSSPLARGLQPSAG